MFVAFISDIVHTYIPILLILDYCLFVCLFTKGLCIKDLADKKLASKCYYK